MLPPKANSFVVTCEKKYTGGFSKTPDTEHPDLLHSFYSLAWFALNGERGLRPLRPDLAICDDTVGEGGEERGGGGGGGGGGGASDG